VIWTNVCPVHAASDERIRRLTDLRRAQPADATLQNLLRLLNSKIELCGQLAIYEYEAISERHPECAQAFRALADAERTSFDSLVRCLTVLLSEAELDRSGTKPGRPASRPAA
jgi:hypothetical protein